MRFNDAFIQNVAFYNKNLAKGFFLPSRTLQKVPQSGMAPKALICGAGRRLLGGSSSTICMIGYNDG